MRKIAIIAMMPLFPPNFICVGIMTALSRKGQRSDEQRCENIFGEDEVRNPVQIEYDSQRGRDRPYDDICQYGENIFFRSIGFSRERQSEEECVSVVQIVVGQRSYREHRADDTGVTDDNRSGDFREKIEKDDCGENHGEAFWFFMSFRSLIISPFILRFLLLPSW